MIELPIDAAPDSEYVIADRERIAAALEIAADLAEQECVVITPDGLRHLAGKIRRGEVK